MKVTEYEIGNVTVRVHGDPPPREVLEKACIQFLRGVERDKKGERHGSDCNDHRCRNAVNVDCPSH